MTTHWSRSCRPGQRWGWNLLADQGMGRFGGGWAIKLGIDVSASFQQWVIDLGIGYVRINFKRRPV